MWFLAKRPLGSIIQAATETKSRTLSMWNLAIAGIGAMVGSGVFSLSGIIAANYSGPAIVLSYAMAGLGVLAIALVYAEISAMLPTSGSIYSYAGVAWGELGAWIAFTILIMEMFFGATSAAVVLSTYLANLFEVASGYKIPAKYLATPGAGGVAHLPAGLVTLVLGFVALVGKEGKPWVNTVLVSIKAITMALFFYFMLPYFNAGNLKPFMPFGFASTVLGASIVFQTFLGFNIIPTLASSARNPSRDVPRGIFVSVAITMLLYIAVSLVLVGGLHYARLDSVDAIFRGLEANGATLGKTLVALGITIGIPSVVVIMLDVCARFACTVSEDGLLPAVLRHRCNITGKPRFAIIMVVVLGGACAALVDYRTLAQLCAIGALTEFVLVMLLTLMFRRQYPQLARPFRCPAIVPLCTVCITAILYLLYKQVLDAPKLSWIAVYAVIASLVFYVVYALVVRGKSCSISRG